MTQRNTNPVSQAASADTVAIRWLGDGLQLLDQRRLPQEEHWLTVEGAAGVADAIRDMVVRGAPAIGISAAYGLALAARAADDATWTQELEAAAELLAGSRPTAVNLFWALERMKGVLDGCGDRREAQGRLTREAIAIHQEDLAANRTMAKLAVEAMDLSRPCSVLTHCNTGALATGGYGTALGVVRRLYEQKLLKRVFADETRPWLQGARLTAWELEREGLPVTLNADSAAAVLFARGDVQWVIVGADRITANGDVANKIGTYSLAVLARHHKVKFMVVAPSSTVDMSLEHGADIPIEERSAQEMRQMGGLALAPDTVDVFNPVFDVTPASLIDLIVTEHGVVHSPELTGMRKLFG